MRFKLVGTGKTYAEATGEPIGLTAQGTSLCQEDTRATAAQDGSYPRQMPEVPAVVWEGKVNEYLSLLVLRQAELIVAKAQLTGNERRDWYAKNRILDLEIKIADLRRWLAEAVERENGQWE